jgi:CRP/FNR family transcriptional regulator, cyclic AMP receptor protein
LNSEPTVHFDPSVFLSTPGAGLVIKKYGSGTVIFAQGDAAQDIFYIQAGQVKITVISEVGRCPASAPMRQIGRVEEGRISGPS